MDVGMFFEQQCPRPWTEDAEAVLFRNSLEQGEIGDRIGISCAWAQEHHFLEEYSHSTAPEIFLAALSQRTKRIRLGHGISLMAPGYNHPVRVAERIATLDLVSGGRVEWGTGESSSRLELEGFQLNYLEKRAMWAEGLRECTRMLAATPYPGIEGKYFSMPERNIVPKPVQRPHPPLWVACTNRETLKMAARLGLGALTFAFMDGREARHWVNEYHETFATECRPIGQTVNPKVAVLAGMMCHADGAVARDRGLEGQRFFKWALAHYYRYGAHIPGMTNLWEEFRKAPVEPMAGTSAVGSPEEVRASLEDLERAGVDQVILLQQAAGYDHTHICESLELFGAEVLPDIIERHEDSSAERASKLAPAIESALARVAPIADASQEPVVAYEVLWGKKGSATGAGRNAATRRSVEGTDLWRQHVGGFGKAKSD